MTYKISAVQIENGVITTAFYGTTQSQREFLKTQSIIEEFRVSGWKMSKVYLTHGTQENGEGWGFYK